MFKLTQKEMRTAHVVCVLVVALFLTGIGIFSAEKSHAVEKWGVTYTECENLDVMYSNLSKEIIEGKATINIAGKIDSSDPRECDTFSLNKDMYNNIIIPHEIYSNLYDCSTVRFYQNGTMWYGVTMIKENTAAAKTAQTKLNKYESRAKSILKSLNLQGKSDFEKASAIYDWVINNITYDWSMKRYTGYDGLIYGETICDGYANIFRRLCYGAGLECRYLSSQSHAYNIVCVGGKWYYVDTTLEEKMSRPLYDKDPEGWRWFLCGKDNFSYGSLHNTYAYYNLPRYNVSTIHYIMPGKKVNPSKITSKKKSGTKATIKWRKASKVTGYQLGYKPAGGKWTVKTYSNKTLKATIKKLKKNKKYYFKIRTYQKISGKTYYSRWK